VVNHSLTSSFFYPPLEFCGKRVAAFTLAVLRQYPGLWGNVCVCGVNSSCKMALNKYSLCRCSSLS